MDSDKDQYKTIKESSRAEIKRKKSKFIALAYPAKSERAAGEIIAKLEKEYRHASHVCWAYRINSSSGKIIGRYDDAGEPAQSAGPPILNHIRGMDLLNVLVVVIRYFGGVKLGIGGLIRAYGDAAKLVLDQAEIITKVIKESVKFYYPYSTTGQVLNLINRFGIEVVGSEYSDLPALTIRVRRSKIKELKNALRKATGGKVEFYDSDP